LDLFVTFTALILNLISKKKLRHEKVLFNLHLPGFIVI